MDTDKIFLDVDLNRHGIRVYLNTVENLTGIPQWITLKNIRFKSEFISHLCLSKVNQRWQLSVVYDWSTTRKFVKRKKSWKEILENNI